MSFLGGEENLQQERVKSGARGEKVAELALYQAGFRAIERVENAWSVIRRGGKVVSAFPKAKVSADFWAVVPGSGRAVRVEVKSTKVKTLSLSGFRDHQLYELERFNQLGGLSLLAWVSGGECILYEWPILGFEKGAPLKWPSGGLSPEGVVFWLRRVSRG